MQTKRRMALAITLSGLACAGTVFAQVATSGEIRDLKGSVMVLKGKDYLNATQGMALGAGDRVLVLEKAQAKVVVNAAGQRCEIELKENQALTVAAADCKALAAAVQTVPGAAAPGSTAVAANGSASPPAAVPSAGPMWFGGAAAIGGAVYLGVRSKASGD